MNIEIIRNEEQFLLHLITKLWSTQTFKVVYMVVMGRHLLFIISLLSCLLVNVCFATKQMIILSGFFFLEMSVEVVVKNSCQSIGEGPHWDDRTNSLLYVDILSNDVHRWSPDTGNDEMIHLGTYMYI